MRHVSNWNCWTLFGSEIDVDGGGDMDPLTPSPPLVAKKGVFLWKDIFGLLGKLQKIYVSYI